MNRFDVENSIAEAYSYTCYYCDDDIFCCDNCNEDFEDGEEIKCVYDNNIERNVHYCLKDRCLKRLKNE